MNTEKLKTLFEGSTDKYSDARKMGSSYQTIYNIIYKGSIPRVDLLERIAAFYGKPVGYFFDEEENTSAKCRESQKRETVRLQAKIEAYENALRLIGANIKQEL